MIFFVCSIKPVSPAHLNNHINQVQQLAEVELGSPHLVLVLIQPPLLHVVDQGVYLLLVRSLVVRVCDVESHHDAVKPAALQLLPHPVREVEEESL